MKRFLFAPIVLIAVSCENKDSNLHGAWERDAEATIANLTEGQSLDESKKQFLDAWFSCKMVITYEPNGTGTVALGRYTLPGPDGTVHRMEPSEDGFTFEILHEQPSQISIKTESDFELPDGPPSYVLKFEDENTYTVTLDQGPFDLKGKEFFRRVGASKSEQDSGDDP